MPARHTDVYNFAIMVKSLFYEIKGLQHMLKFTSLVAAVIGTIQIRTMIIVVMSIQSELMKIKEI